jgi:hypothetical protein
LKALSAALRSARDTESNSERCAILGSAYKRKAALLAKEKRPSRERIDEALRQSADAYAAGLHPDPARLDPYNALNCLFLEAVLQKRGTSEQLEQARQAGERARERYQSDHDIWKAIQSVDALLVEALLDGRLESKEGDKAKEALATDYRTLFMTIHATDREIDSVVSQLRLLETLLRSRGRGEVADRLRDLTILINPARGGQDAGNRSGPAGGGRTAPKDGSKKRSAGAKKAAGRKKRK